MLQQCFERLSDDVAALWSPREVPRIHQPDALTFLRDYVARCQPVIMTGLMDDWPDAGVLEDLDALERECGDLDVTVDVTPTGLGDAVLAHPDSAEPLFVKPEERRMSFREFLTVLRARGADGFAGVPYLSHQNDSLRQEFSKLLRCVPAELPLATAAFGNAPEAVNLWVGDERAVTSVHKDYYENLYCVLQGEKHFVLLPPTDGAFLPEVHCVGARYRSTQRSDAAAAATAAAAGGDAGDSGEVRTLPFDDNFCVVLDRDAEAGAGAAEASAAPAAPARVPWIAVDPARPERHLAPAFHLASPVTCVLRPGETLYLPAMWYHRVGQEGVTVAVNYWHDMAFDHRYVCASFAKAVAGVAMPGCGELAPHPLPAGAR